MNEIKLLPCPFCGGKAEIREVDYDPEWHPTYNDPDSGGDAPVYVISCKSCEAGIKYKYKESEAVQAWNTRKPIDDMVEQLEKSSDYYECDEQGREHVQMIDLSEAIDIVRGGRE